MTIHLNGVQVDIQAAIVINSITGVQTSFQHIYFARIGGDNMDKNDDPCIPNPCKNNGLCLPSINRTFSCLCSSFSSGNKYNHKNI